MALAVEINGSDVILSGDVLSADDYLSIVSCRSELEKYIALSSGKSLKINLSLLDAVSSIVLSMFLCFIREAKQSSCDIVFVNMSQGLFDMARVGGVESLFPRLGQ